MVKVNVMISALWLIPAFIIGGLFGIFILALVQYKSRTYTKWSMEREYMKVSDLIEELKRFPQDKEVRIFTEKDSIPYDVKRVFHDESFNGDFSYVVIEEVKE